MLTFAQCTACLARPRALIADSNLLATNGSVSGKITDGLVDLGRETVVLYQSFQCAACGTYYRFESVDIGITRLFRITIAEAQGIFASDENSPRQRREQAQRIEAHYAGIVAEMQACLTHASPVVREYAAETLADEYKKLGRWAELRALIRHSDAAVRMGVLHSFAERPYQGYSFGCPNGFRNRHYATCKPFVEPVRFLREFVELVCAPEAQIRHFVFCMLSNSYLPDDKMVPALRRVPLARRSREHKELLIARLWAGKEPDVDELVQLLFDADAEVRNKALWRMRELSRERHHILESTVEMFLAKIRSVGEQQWSDEVRAYVQAPAGPEPEDDPWD